MLVDTHCHINSSFYPRTAGGVIRRAREAGVKFMINVGVDIPGSIQAAETAAIEDGMLFSPGIHPGSAGGADEKDTGQLREIALSGKASAVGETGLDFYRKAPPARAQEELFKTTILIAIEAGLPLIIHNRNAGEKILKILSEYYSGNENNPNGVFHCFSEDERFAEKCIKLNFYLSFAGNLTYPGSDNLRRAAGSIPVERLLIETDSPFLAPQAKRGKPNEPSFLVHTAEELARIKGVEIKKLIQATGDNAARVFKKIKLRGD